MSKQTAVDWLSEQTYNAFNSMQQGYITMADFRFKMLNFEQQALAMEREQIEQSYSDGLGNGCHYERGDAAESVLDEKQYYNETYGKEASYEA